MSGAFGIRNRTKRSSIARGMLLGFEAGRDGLSPSSIPLVLSGAKGCRVRDADGNRFIDMTSFFGVALAGHRNPAVVSAARIAAGHLIHSMGDVHPDEWRARLLASLNGLMPAKDYRGHLSLNGSDAVETALKYAAAATGRAGIISFEGAYHGLSAGALEATYRQDLRSPFEPMLSGRAAFAPWPAADGSDMDRVLSIVEELATDDVIGKGGVSFGRPGALIVEPIQGRGGIRVPPPGFLPGLARICSRYGMVFITDEIYCGTYRTGTFLASEPEGVEPDIVCLGKALGGGFPLSVAMMKDSVASAIPRTGPEALHTSTFCGWPVSCAAAVATLKFLGGIDPASSAARIESTVRAAAAGWAAVHPGTVRIRGRGAMLGLEAGTGNGGGLIAATIVQGALELGVITITEGACADVVAIMPPLTIDDKDLGTALRILGIALNKAMK